MAEALEVLDSILDMLKERVKLLLERDGPQCVYCGVEFSVEELPTRDHVVPKCQGGKTIIENLVAACSPCNIRKGGQTPLQANMPIRYGALKNGSSGTWRESWVDPLASKR